MDAISSEYVAREHSDSSDVETVTRLQALLGDSGYARSIDPIAPDFPSQCYTSQAWLTLENDRLFARSWVFVATDAQLDRAGTIKPIDIAGHPIIVVRDNVGEVRAFHNICRHRGTLLVKDRCRRASITCPYHAWTYSLTGDLTQRPHFFAANDSAQVVGEDAKQLALRPVRLERWNGCYFVNLADESESLRDWLSPLDARTHTYDLSESRWIGKLEFTVKCNWKLVIENYMDGYHVFSAHPRLLKHAPMDVRWSGDWEEYVHYNDYVAPKLTQGRGDTLPHFSNLSPEDRCRGFWFITVPNLAVEIFADQMVFLVAYPVSPTETREELHFFVAGDQAATDEKFAQSRRELIQMWDDLNKEDIDLLERLQRGRSSSAYTGAENSPHWDCALQHLPRKIIERMIRRD